MNDNNGLRLSGWLYKKGDKPPIKLWRLRWFQQTLTDVEYSKKIGSKVLGHIILDDVICVVDPNVHNRGSGRTSSSSNSPRSSESESTTFDVHVKSGRIYKLQAYTAREKMQWMELFSKKFGRRDTIHTISVYDEPTQCKTRLQPSSFPEYIVALRLIEDNKKSQNPEFELDADHYEFRRNELAEKLSFVPKEMGELTHLRYLKLNSFSRGLQQLPEELIALKLLERFESYASYFTHFPLVLTKMTTLKRLDLSFDKYAEIPPQIANLTNLKHLKITHCKALKTLPDDIGALSNLQELVLQINGLTLLPKTIGNLSSLEALDVSDNCITDIPSEIGSLVTLKILNLGSNCLTRLPNELGLLKGLQSITIESNPLPADLIARSVDKDALLEYFQCNLNGVAPPPVEQELISSTPAHRIAIRLIKEAKQNQAQEFTLDGDHWEFRRNNVKLDFVPKEIKYLSGIKSFKLDGFSGHPLRSIPGEILALTKLIKLTSYASYFEIFPEVVCQMTWLQHLEMHFDSYRSLPSSIGKLAQLTTLNVSYCDQLTLIPPEIEQLTNLKTLIMQNNALISLPITLYKLSKLKELVLCDNNISQIVPEIEKLTSLTTLDIARNKIEELPLTIGSLLFLKQLRVDGNPLPEEILCRTDIDEMMTYFQCKLRGEEPPIVDATIRNLPEDQRIAVQLIKEAAKSNVTILQLEADGYQFRQNKLVLTQIPPQIGILTNLNSFRLQGASGVRFHGLPEEFSKLRNLKSFSSYAAYFPEFPNLFELTVLTNIELWFDEYTEIPSSIARLQLLERMTISCCAGLCTIPDEIGQLSNLKELTLQQNDIKNLPSSLCTLANLEVLNISNNAIQELPSTISQLKALRFLDVTSNRLQSLPKELGFLQGSLATLQLDSNPLPLEIIVRSIDANEVLGYLKAQAEGVRVKSLFDTCVLYVLANKPLFSAKLESLPAEVTERVRQQQNKATKVSKLLQMIRSSTTFY